MYACMYVCGAAEGACPIPHVQLVSFGKLRPPWKSTPTCPSRIPRTIFPWTWIGLLVCNPIRDLHSLIGNTELPRAPAFPGEDFVFFLFSFSNCVFSGGIEVELLDRDGASAVQTKLCACRRWFSVRLHTPVRVLWLRWDNIYNQHSRLVELWLLARTLVACAGLQTALQWLCGLPSGSVNITIWGTLFLLVFPLLLVLSVDVNEVMTHFEPPPPSARNLSKLNWVNPLLLRNLTENDLISWGEGVGSEFGGIWRHEGWANLPFWKIRTTDWAGPRIPESEQKKTFLWQYALQCLGQTAWHRPQSKM